jgi:ADP-ribose pyrophosphatase YjhB (NUDIX family)
VILRGDTVLLVRRNRAPFSGFWDIPGGFLHPEELPKPGALREVQEETGLLVDQLSFLGFYIDHYDFQGERHTILNIYYVGQSEGVPHAGDDAEEVAWFPLDDLPERVAFEHARCVLADARAWSKRCS